MPANLEFEPNDICVLRIGGTLAQAEFQALQEELGRRIDAGAKPRLLAIADGFEGWQRGADWDDLDFMLSHGDDIVKIAVVADKKWEPQALAFAGAGLRQGPVKFFQPNEMAQARTWLNA